MIKLQVHTSENDNISIKANNIDELDELYNCFYKQAYYFGCGLMIDMRKVEYIEYSEKDCEDE